MNILAAFQTDVSVRRYKDGQPAPIEFVALGVAGEAGEVVDLVKKIAWHGKPLNYETRTKLIEELGDLLWYVTAMAQCLGSSLEDVMNHNIEKLAKRYPHGFVEGGGNR